MATTVPNKSRFRNMSKEERLKIIRCFHVTIPRAEEILRRISECHSTYDGKNDPDHIYISGDTGVGKTTITKTYENKFPRTETDTDDIVKVLRIEAPVPATCKELATELLHNLGDPKADAGGHNIGKKTRRLVAMLKACRTELIIIDEFQHFIHQRRSNTIEEVSDWLKNLMNKIPIPIVLVGLPDSELAIRDNQQLSRRFSERYKIEPFRWTNDTNKGEFKRLLKEIDNCLPFDHELYFSHGLMPYYFYKACNGTLAHLIKLIRKAAKSTVINDGPTIYMETLAQAWEDVSKPDVCDPCSDDPEYDNIANPFDIDQPLTVDGTTIVKYNKRKSRFGESDYYRRSTKKLPISQILARR